MNYEMASQLSAHTILAVSDFSYLVLSLEGGKWVVYAVKDTSGKAKSLLSGAVVDLEQVKKEGNDIVKVPVSDEEMEKILDKSKQEKK
jgi:preprotein translocase subunit SecD